MRGKCKVSVRNFGAIDRKDTLCRAWHGMPTKLTSYLIHSPLNLAAPQFILAPLKEWLPL
jgi:hypothetical protein